MGNFDLFGLVQSAATLATGFLAVLLGVFVFWKRGREEYFGESDVVDGVFKALWWGLVAGRVVYVLVNLEDFRVNVYYWIAVWYKPGIIWQGAAIGALAGFYRHCLNLRWNWYKALDIGVIGLACAQFWMNVSTFLSGAVVGKPTNWFVGIIMPGTFEKRHPVNLYAAVLWLVLFGFLWWVEGKYRRFTWYQKAKGDARPGFLFFSYLIGFGLIGFLAKLFSEVGLSVGGIDIDVLSRLLILVVGIAGLYLRSGLSVKAGFDEMFAGVGKQVSRIRLGKKKKGKR